QKRARLDVERGFPELTRVHLAQAFVALQCYALAGRVGYGFEKADRAVDSLLVVLAAQLAGSVIDFLQPLSVFVELAGVGRTKEGVVDDGDILDPAYGALENEALAFHELSAPAAFDFLGLPIKP